MIKRNTLLTLGALCALTLPTVQGAMLLVADPDANKVWQVNEAGGTSTFATLGANNPTGVAVSGAHVFVLDSGNETIHRYSSDGVWQQSFISSGVSAIAADLLGNVYAASLVNNTVSKYNWVGTPQGGPLAVDAPTALAVSSAGDVFVAETTINGLEIMRYSSSLAPLGVWAAPTNDPNGLAFSGSELYGALSGAGEVEKYAPGVTTFVGSGLNLPVALVFAANGDLFVANSGTNEVLRFSAAGAPLGSFGGAFSSVAGLAFTATPEPETYAMLGGGLLLLGFLGRKR